MSCDQFVPIVQATHCLNSSQPPMEHTIQLVLQQIFIWVPAPFKYTLDPPIRPV